MIKIITTSLLLINFISFSQTTVPSFFSDNMVLQQKEAVTIWGNDIKNKQIIVKGSWGSIAKTKTKANGKWKLQLKTPSAGGPHQLIIQGSEKIEFSNVMIGEVWLCSGQSNMEMPLKGFKNQPVEESNETILNAKNSNIRLFNVKRNTSLKKENEVNGYWAIASPKEAPNFSATAYFFAKKIEGLLNIPIGLITISWGGSTIESWMDKESLSEYKHIEIPSKIPLEKVQTSPTLLYNGMLHPLIGYTIKGAIWYQGESNKNNALEYDKLMNSMISSWREQWGLGDFSFYFTQIAPSKHGKGNSSALLREAQLKATKTIKNTGMAVILDIGDYTFIHPRNKKTVGDRLAYWALAKDYGIEGFGYSSPTFKTAKYNTDGSVVLEFENAPNGISSFGKPITDIELAGKDKIFYPAKATILGKKKALLVTSDNVKKPVAVRYGFKNYVKGSLYGTNGLPVSSFRTDNW